MHLKFITVVCIVIVSGQGGKHPGSDGYFGYLQSFALNPLGCSGLVEFSYKQNVSASKTSMASDV